MRVKTAFILCAGLGKRLNPLTLENPKPLLKLKNITMLENCIKLIIKLTTYGAKIFRLDAVAFLWKESGTTCLNLPETHEIIKLLRIMNFSLII